MRNTTSTLVDESIPRRTGINKAGGKGGKVYGKEATAETVPGSGKVYGKEATAETVAGRGGKPSASLLNGGKASSSHIPKPPSRAAQLDQAVGGRIQKAAGIGGIPESSSRLRRGFTKQGNRAMGVAGTAAIAHEGYQAGHEFGEGLEAQGKAEEYRESARKAREAGNITIADKLDKRAEEYEAEASQKMSQGLQDEARLVGTIGVAATATGGAALAGYGAYKTGEASYGAGKSLSERMIAEEYGREVANAQREGRAASDATARANAKARIVGEVTGMRAGMERIMRDTDADRAAADMGRRLEGRRHDAILDMDDGLHEIARIEKRMRDLDRNPNQDDPWVKERRQELLDAYTAKRNELQRTNEALGVEAGAGDGESIAVRGAVALIPEKPNYRREEGEQVEEVADAVLRDPGGEIEEVPDAVRRDEKAKMDDLAKAMVDNQVTAEEKAQWRGQGAADPNSVAGEAVRDFTGTNPAGYTDAERTKHAGGRVSRTPDRVKKKDVEEERKRAEEQERRADQRRANQQRLDEARFTNDWNRTIRDINDSLSKLNEQDAKKVKDMTQAAIIMIQQMQNGRLSGDDFTRQMAALENEHANLEQEGLGAWQRIREGLMGNQTDPGGGRADIQIGDDEADPCVNNFTMTNNSELRCKCPGYTFDNSKVRCVKTGAVAVKPKRENVPVPNVAVPDVPRERPPEAPSGGLSDDGGGPDPETAAVNEDICPCVDEDGRRYRTPFGLDCDADLGAIDKDYNCSDTGPNQWQ